MELSDYTGELRDLKEVGGTRSGLGIDLNEIPSPLFNETLPDSIDIVRTYHENPPPPPGGPAGIPGEDSAAACAVCAKPEVRGYVIVCDGCERGCHLGCVGMRCRQPFCLDEWLCGECSSTDVKSKRWPLGVKSKHILDINASPPSDGDGHGNEDSWELRKHTPDGNSFGANPFGAPMTCPKFSNGYATQAVKLFEDVLNHNSTVNRSLQEADLNFSMGKHRSSNNTAVRRPHRTTNEIFLQALKEFVADRNGALEEGWHVDVRQSMNSSDVHAVYCSPDGKLFDSVFEVASYLGLMSNNNYAEPTVRNERSILKMEGSHIPRKRKPARFAVPNGSVENKDGLVSGHCKESSANGGRTECPNACESTSKVSETGQKDEDTSGYQQAEFADFFVISMGRLDARPSYNDVDIIWPVGYKSCWHDKITGSIFTCEVLDGGDSGPLFKVKRCSCCDTPVPVGSTILSLANPTKSVRQTNKEGQLRSYDDWDGDSIIQMILSDPCLPMDNDIFSCLTSSSNKASDSQPQELLQPGLPMIQNKTEISMHNEREQTDEIGEISAEECSSSLAWSLLSKKIVDVCIEIYKQKGTVKFFCKHVESEKCLLKWDMESAISNNNSLSAFAKFYGSPGFTCIPSIVQGDHHELNAVVEAISKWLDQDRFGLDMAFVQEMLEQQLGAQGCCRYQFLNTRSDYSTSRTVSNGFLVMETTGQLQYNEEGASNRLCGRSKSARFAEEPNISNHCPPQGKPVCSRVPSELAGDVFQAWELLCRFQETLDLKESVSLEDLEEELMSPWFDGTKSQGMFDKEAQGHQVSSLQGVDSDILSVSSESNSKVSLGNPPAFIPLETEAMKEEAQVKLASSTYSRCYGVALTKAHIALLGVLISELQTKVAALVDPNFEPGESRPKRGRKKDIDPTTSYKRSKLNMLPVNELTWPELARRYVLAVLSMDGNLDSAEITARESGKVFRCLQGDGGLLCGSLTGIAGMEADALLLAEATKHIFGSITKESEVLTIEDEGSEAKSDSEKNLVINGDIPEWAKSLEPVRKLPTNVGTRIRKCVYDALDKNPPEWARKILEHSISKEVYKGNASGPTKKAVLSVLGTVWQGGLEQKPAKATKRKIVISVSDIIMKQCRIVLRRAAAADDAKVFCNLLGRKLINSCDNDDEGLLGSPAMVSRPLDFRTIDLRLATGAYGGSHEAFLEDVHELWNNLRIAYGDQPDLVELADNLSDKFESLYENEVVRYVRKFVDYAKVERLSTEMRKELDELTASMCEIPKAPWDDGVCKVCGVDKDDDSVLLCDTCDAEYHTYCLNPPLVRIPEGNWYCPSCIVSKHMTQDVSGRQQVEQRQTKKSREVTSVYLEALAHLSTVMEEKEYWEYSASERAFLLKFLSDELLNSTLVRQHLEQCAELSTDLNQKLRSFYFEWKSLKMKEDIISAKVVKMDTFPMSMATEVGIKVSTSVLHSSKSLVQQHSLSDTSNHFVVLPESHASQESGKEKSTVNSVDSAVLVTKSETDGRHTNPIVVVGQMMDASVTSDGNKASSNLTSTDTDAPNKPIQSSLSNDFGPLRPKNETESYQLELNAIKNDISLLQDSIMTAESQLFKLTVRREFMGIDSIGRLYWAAAMPGGCPCIIVDATAMMHGGKSVNHTDLGSKFPFLQNHAPFNRTFSSPMVPKAGISCGRSNCLSFSSPCISYHTDADVDMLIDWMRHNDPKERELRESIIHWKKVRSQETSHTGSQAQKEQHVGSSISMNIENVNDSCLVAKATSFLEKKYGPCIEFDSIDISKKRNRKAEEINEEKTYRCECLELIWPSRQHCLYCHRTFLSNMELEGHNEGKCSLVSAVSEKSKDDNEHSRGKESKKSETIRDGHRTDADTITTSKAGSPELSRGLIRFQNEDQLCPYNFADICSKFVTNDSNRVLVNEIGLIGLGGVPSFVPSVSSFVSDSTLMLMTSQEDAGVTGGGSKALDRKNSQGKSNLTHSLGKEIAEKTSADEIGELGKCDKPIFIGQTRNLGDFRCCVVPLSSLRPLVGKVSHISRQLKINLLDMDTAVPDDALRPSKAQLERRWAWRAFVKSAGTIYEMVQATIILEDMIKTEYLRNDWWYWSSLSAAAKTSTLSSLALRIYSLDAAILYEKSFSASAGTVSSEATTSICDQKSSASVDVSEKFKASRKSSRKRKEPDV